MYIVKSIAKKGKYYYFKTNDINLARVKFNQCAAHNHDAEIYDTQEDEILDSTEWKPISERVNNESCR